MPTSIPLQNTNITALTELKKEIDFMLQLPRESARIEFAASESWDDVSFRMKIVKTAIAMSNHRDGGIIVVGVKGETPEGMMPEHLETFQAEKVLIEIGKYASPSVHVDTYLHEQEGKQFIVISTRQFFEVPTIVRKDAADGTAGSHSFKRSDLLIRTEAPPQSIRVQDERDLRNLIDLASEIRAQRIISTSKRIGLVIPDDSLQLFRQQQNTNLSQEGIFSGRANWQYVVFGSRFEKNFLESNTRLAKIISESVIRIRGWPFPCPAQASYLTGEDYIANSVDCMKREFWQFWQSGQFYFKGLPPEEADITPEWNSELRRSLQIWGPEAGNARGVIALISNLYRFIEVFAFARRLSAKEIYPDEINIEVTLSNALGYVLTTDSSRLLRPMREVTSAAPITVATKTNPIEIQEDLRSLTLRAFNRMLETCFGWTDLPEDAFAGDYDKIIEEARYQI